MKVRVALEAPVMPPETGPSIRLGWAALQPEQGLASWCSEAAATAASTSLAVGGSMVDESINKAGLTPPAGHPPGWFVYLIGCTQICLRIQAEWLIAKWSEQS